MNEIDFVIPLCKKNMIIRTTIECIIFNYHPKNIYVITNPKDIKYLENECKKWDRLKTKIFFIDEDSFFIKNYNLSRKEIESYYTHIDDKSREFGWWYQQILKLGAFKQIDNLSDPFVVWDSDLISKKNGKYLMKTKKIINLLFYKNVPKMNLINMNMQNRSKILQG